MGALFISGRAMEMMTMKMKGGWQELDNSLVGYQLERNLWPETESFALAT